MGAPETQGAPVAPPASASQVKVMDLSKCLRALTSFAQKQRDNEDAYKKFRALAARYEGDANQKYQMTCAMAEEAIKLHQKQVASGKVAAASSPSSAASPKGAVVGSSPGANSAISSNSPNTPQPAASSKGTTAAAATSLASTPVRAVTAQPTVSPPAVATKEVAAATTTATTATSAAAPTAGVRGTTRTTTTTMTAATSTTTAATTTTTATITATTSTAAAAAANAPPPPPLLKKSSSADLSSSGQTKRKQPGSAVAKQATKKQKQMEERRLQLEREAEEERLRKERAKPYEGLSIEAMRAKRMEEVMAEMSTRLRNIVERTWEALGKEAPSGDVLDKLCEVAAKAGGGGGGGDGDARQDQRAAYLQAIHQQKEEVDLPKELNAELMPHQEEGLEWLASVYINNLHGILADEMGLGKTLQTIAWLQWLKESKGNKGPHLIVAPKSTLTNWKAEFERFAPTYKTWLIVGDQEEREALATKLRKRVKGNKTTCFITNYEQIHRNDWLQDFSWQCIVIDEGHRMKNQNSVLHQTMTKMTSRTKMLLTGTPLQNNMNELWALLHYLLPDIFSTSLDFKSFFLEPLRGVEGLNEYEVSMTAEDENLLVSRLHLMLSPFLLQRTKAQVMEQKLPPKVEHIVRVPLSDWQRSAYMDLQNKTIRVLSGDDKVATGRVNNVLMQLRKIVLHPFLFTGDRTPGPELIRTSGKVEALDRMLRKLLPSGHKVLIFSQFTSVLDVLMAYLKWRGINFARLDGQTRHEERRRQMETFSDPKAGLDVFLLSARAGGLGLNLQAADTVILFDLDWNPQNDKQAIARAHRFGQKKEVRVFRLLTNSRVEQHMERKCTEKLDLEKKIIGAGMFTKSATQEQRSVALRSILGLEAEAGASKEAMDEAVSLAEKSLNQDTTSADDLNVLLARSDEELEAFRKIDSELLKPEDNSDPSQPLLVRCGRQMKASEVPDGFRMKDEDDDESEEDVQPTAAAMDVDDED